MSVTCHGECNMTIETCLMKEGLVFHLGRIPLGVVCAVVPAWRPRNLLECRLSQHDRQSHAWHVAKGMTNTLAHDRQRGVQQAL